MFSVSRRDAPPLSVSLSFPVVAVILVLLCLTLAAGLVAVFSSSTCLDLSGLKLYPDLFKSESSQVIFALLLISL